MHAAHESVLLLCSIFSCPACLSFLINNDTFCTRAHTQAENSTQKQLDLIKINDNTKRNLEQEIQGYKMEAQRQSKLIFQLEKEREKYAVEASEAAAKYMQVRLVWHW